MTDYGTELEFGASVEPLADPPDRAGLELFGIQDHPYQRRSLDTWTRGRPGRARGRGRRAVALKAPCRLW